MVTDKTECKNAKYDGKATKRSATSAGLYLLRETTTAKLWQEWAYRPLPGKQKKQQSFCDITS